MRGFVTGICLLLSTAAFADPPNDELRLIKYGPGINDVRWMPEHEIHGLSQKAHRDGHCGGFMDITDHPQKRTRAPIPTHFPLAITQPTEHLVVNTLLNELSADNMEATVRELSSFPSRFYRSEDGVRAAHLIRDRFAAYAAGRSDITIGLFNHRFAQPSVVARIEGSDPLLATETVIIGGHEDSINGWGFGNAPGADDNASGIATILEVFRVIAQSGYQPRRTLEFMTYAGEERGLLGSQDIAEQYRSFQKQVVGVMQFDMTMHPGRSHKMTLITDHTNPELTTFTQQLIDTYVQFPWIQDRCGYACSDHASWHEAGYASVFPFESPTAEMNSAIHTTRDLVSLLDANYGLNFAKLGVAFAVELTSQ